MMDTVAPIALILYAEHIVGQLIPHLNCKIRRILTKRCLCASECMTESEVVWDQ